MFRTYGKAILAMIGALVIAYGGSTKLVGVSVGCGGVRGGP
jgi:hypothetical protein